MNLTSETSERQSVVDCEGFLNTVYKMDNENNLSSDDDAKPKVVKTAADLQRLKIEKLMKNPEKLVILPERPKDKSFPNAPDFVRNVMGSSAGAGSGEFHVYRHLRRKEYARQKHIQEKSEKDILNDQYHTKVEDNRRKAEEKTAKKRAKRLKKKSKLKHKVKKPKISESQKSDKDNSESDSSEGESDNAEDKSEKNSAVNE